MGGELAPRVIGNYEVIRKLASGGMGEVYLARQKGPVNLSRRVVLKRLHEEFTSDPSFIEMFLNEARIAANLAHSNIIHIYELFQDGSGYVIAMEYVRGGSALDLLRAKGPDPTRRGLPYGAAVRIVAAVCDALHYAYQEPDAVGQPRRIVHRDVSPSNILIGYDGQVKLVDFGIAKALEAEAVTKATTIKGKYGYLSPEQVRSQPLDQRSDLFSLGTCLWEMTVGRPLFRRESELQMMYAILEEPIPAPSTRVDDYPPDLERVVMKALARSRDDRYADAEEFGRDLRALAREHDWDVEASTLGQLVRERLPDDHVAFGRIGSGSDSLMTPLPPRPQSIRVSTVPADDFESIVVDDSGLRDGARTPTPGFRLRRADWITIGALSIASLVFWLAVVPRL